MTIEHPVLRQLRDDGVTVLPPFRADVRWPEGAAERAVLWCLDCDCEASQADSYGDCADCGGPVVWIDRGVVPDPKPERTDG